MLRGIILAVFTLVDTAPPHVVEALAFVGIVALLLLVAVVVVLVTDALRRLLLWGWDRWVLYRRLSRLDAGTCDGLSRLERQRMAFWAVREIREEQELGE